MNNVYVVIGEVKTDDITCDKNCVLGVFDDEAQAFEFAKNTILAKYKKDLVDTYGNDNSSLEFSETEIGYEYHSNFDFYNVRADVYPRKIGDKSYANTL